MPKTILIVDDEIQILRLLTPVFRQRDLRVLTATSVKEAEEVMLQTAPDVVVSDLRMPGGNGTDLLETVRKFERHIPVVLMTGFSDLSVEEALRMGAEALIAKPFSLREMVGIVNRALAHGDSASRTAHLHVHVEVQSRNVPVDQVNLSHGGMFVPLEGDLPAELDRVHIKFNFSGASMPPLEGTALVRWVRRQSRPGYPRGVGIEFISLPVETRRRVLRMAQVLDARATLSQELPIPKKAG